MLRCSGVVKKRRRPRKTSGNQMLDDVLPATYQHTTGAIQSFTALLNAQFDAAMAR
jgi:hypothetical protein